MAIQLVELRAFKSLPILAYCNMSPSVYLRMDSKRKNRGSGRFDTISMSSLNHPNLPLKCVGEALTPARAIAYSRHGEKLVEGTQEDANAYCRQQDVQPLGHLGNALPCDLVTTIFGRSGLTASCIRRNGRVRGALCQRVGNGTIASCSGMGAVGFIRRIRAQERARFCCLVILPSLIHGHIAYRSKL